MAKPDDTSSLSRGLRFDLIIALCALLISTLATAASWWQTRMLGIQTHVLQQQLGAQVWPYVGVAERLTGDTVRISIVNDGLGPAILRSASATVDGKPVHGYVDIMHAILGRNIMARVPHGENLGLALSGTSSGSVLRPGDADEAFALTSKRFAHPFILAYRRLNLRVCYCAIVPNTCWQTDSNASSDPHPLARCEEIAGDLLHESPVDALERRF